MGNTKLYFSVFLLIIAGLLVFASLNKIDTQNVNIIEIGSKIVRGNINEYSLEEAQTYSCTIETPQNKTVILRIDDIARWQDFGLMQNMVEDITEREYGVNLGIIPHKLEEDYKLIRWLQKMNQNPNIELSQHGYDHSKEEFGHLNYDDATKTLNLGRDIMIRLFGETPMNQIPPYNVNSQDTINAIKDLNFKTFSGEVDEYIIEDDFVRVGYTATTYYYDEDRFVYADEVLNDCSNSLDKDSVCVIMIHPQDFTTSGKIDNEKYAEYVKVLDGLQNLDADVVNFRQAFCEEY